MLYISKYILAKLYALAVAWHSSGSVAFACIRAGFTCVREVVYYEHVSYTRNTIEIPLYPSSFSYAQRRSLC
jgi:hypothetical protein